jgi:hypothetical protein
MSEVPESSSREASFGPRRPDRRTPEQIRLHILGRFVLSLGLILLVGFGLLLVGGAIPFSILDYNRAQWSVRATNLGEVPCTLIVTFDSPGGPQREFRDLPAAKGYHTQDQRLVKERGSGFVHSIRVVGQGGKERTITIDAELPEGSDMSIRIDGDLNIKTDVDLDAHVGFE